jgi:hypothetical protein
MALTQDATPRLTSRQAAILGAFTGVLMGPFSEMHAYIEEIMGRPVWTHEMGSKALAKEISDRARPDFLALVDEVGDAR